MSFEETFFHFRTDEKVNLTSMGINKYDVFLLCYYSAARSSCVWQMFTAYVSE